MMSLFFFKQKTAYEMRISDWSSDVCSSDLRQGNSRNATHVETCTPLHYHDLLSCSELLFVVLAFRTSSEPLVSERRLAVHSSSFENALLFRICVDRKSTRLNSSH